MTNPAPLSNEPRKEPSVKILIWFWLLLIIMFFYFYSYNVCRFTFLQICIISIKFGIYVFPLWRLRWSCENWNWCNIYVTFVDQIVYIISDRLVRWYILSSFGIVFIWMYKSFFCCIVFLHFSYSQSFPLFSTLTISWISPFIGIPLVCKFYSSMDFQIVLLVSHV